jgi:hypothetical protein
VTLSRVRLWALAAASATTGLALAPLSATSDFLPDQTVWIQLNQGSRA